MSILKGSVAALALACVLATGQVLAGGQQKGVGPNGEVDGLVGKFIDVNGVRTRYFEYGQGEPLVLLHGGSLGSFDRPRNNGNVWAMNIPDLAKRFRVIVPDRIGAGLTDIPKDDNQLSREGDANHVYEFIKAMGLTQVHIAGHSAGGGIAMIVALRHPEVVKTLIVVAVGGQVSVPGQSIARIQEQACQSLAKTDETLAWRCWLNVQSGNPALFADAFFEASWAMYNRPRQREIQAHMAAGAGAAARERERSGDLSWKAVMAGAVKERRLQIPILYVCSATDTHDWLSTDEIAGIQGCLGLYHFFGALNNRVLLIVYDKGGHFAYRQYPERFNYDVAQFIAYWSSGRKGP
jgi:2-hydroxy-6-oxonona-2,4-dienedioate hydrolase